MDLYVEQGFDSRQCYLEYLSLEHEVPMKTVLALADVFGPEEDFDGLPTALQDFSLGD